jgi:hypothetical protein
MNSILHDLKSKQWIWTAANAKHQASPNRLGTGYESLDNVLSSGFPPAGMIHLQSALGCGEIRFMLSILQRQRSENSPHKIYMFIDPPFSLNAEFLLAQNISLAQLVVVRTNRIDDALWSAEQSAKSGACCAVFIWQQTLNHIQVRKLEHAAQKGGAYCVWLHNASQAASSKAQKEGNNSTHLSNLPLSLSLSITRQADNLSITVNKQKIGWAQKAVNVALPFACRTHNSISQRKYGAHGSAKVVPIQASS